MTGLLEVLGEEARRAFNKSLAYCSKSEKSIYDLNQYLYKAGVNSHERDLIIDYLVDENYINEERYCKAYVNDNIKLNYWGKIKIKHYLSQKNLPAKLISEALNEVDQELYLNNLKKVAERKLKQLKEDLSREQKQQKLFASLTSKGYEVGEVMKVTSRLLSVD